MSLSKRPYSRQWKRRTLLEGALASTACVALNRVVPVMAQSGGARVGALLPLTGDADVVAAQMRAGIDAGVEELNARGGVLGRRVEVLYRDTEAHPNKLAQHCHELVRNESVTAVVGPFIAAGRKFAARHLVELGVPLVNATNHEGRFCHPNLFTLGPAPAQDVSPLIEYVDGGVGRNYFLVGSYPSWQNSMFRQSRFRIVDHGGHVSGQALTDVGEKEFEPVLRWISETDADTVLYCVPRSNGPLFIKQAKQMGLLGRLTFAWIGFNETHHALLSAEEAARVVTCSSFVMSDDTPGVRDFVERVKKARGENFPVTYYAHNHGAAIAALGEAWSRAGEVSGRAALTVLPGLRFNSAGGPMTIDAESHHSTLNLVIARGGREGLQVVKRLGPVDANAGCLV